MKTTLGLAAAALLLGGCISHEETIYRDVERVPISFQSEKAAHIFYEALSKPPSKRRTSESETEVSIPIVFHNKRKVVSGENARFNQAVERCDSNHDGTITELEAKIFAATR